MESCSPLMAALMVILMKLLLERDADIEAKVALRIDEGLFEGCSLHPKRISLML